MLLYAGFRKQKGCQGMYAEIPLLKAENSIPGEYGIAVNEHQTKERTFGLHWHDYYTIDIVLDGEGVQYINHQEEAICRGYVQLVSPTDIHGIRTDEQITILSVKFVSNALTAEYETIVYDRSRKSFYPTDEEFQRLVCYARAIKYHQKKKGPFEKEAVRQNFQLILLMLADLKQLEGFQRTEEKAKRMLQYLSEHFRENPPVERMASLLQMSSSYFSTYFKKETGKTLTEYINEQNYEAIVEAGRENNARALRYVQMNIWGDYRNVQRWHAISALEALAEAYAADNEEIYRNVIRRAVWAMADESGNVPWAAPEMMTAVIKACPQHYREFVKIMITNGLDSPMCHLGVLWSVGHLGSDYLNEIEPFMNRIMKFLDHKDGELRGTAVWALKQLQYDPAFAKINSMADDTAEVWIYEDGTLQQKTISQIVDAKEQEICA